VRRPCETRAVQSGPHLLRNPLIARSLDQKVLSNQMCYGYGYPGYYGYGYGYPHYYHRHWHHHYYGY
jgi:hypothetical protein